MVLTCVAIDDEPLALEIVKNYIGKTPQLRLIQCFEDAISGGEFLRQHPVDLLFLGIQMPDISGLELAASLDPKPLIIFTTAHRKFAVEGFELDAVDYLLKPFSLDRFHKGVRKALDYFQFLHSGLPEKEAAVYVYSEYRLVKIPLHDIEYIESLEDYIKIVSSSGASVMTLMTMKNILEKLPSEQFQRIHRSFIVSVSKVTSIQKRKAMLLSGKEIPISDSFAGFITNWKGNI